MILGLASPTYSGAAPADQPLHWLLDRCIEYGLGALEASLPLDGVEEPGEVGRRAADLGLVWVGYWSANLVAPDGGSAGLLERAERALDVACQGGVGTVVLFGSGSKHNRFTRQPPLAEQQDILVDHLAPVAAAAARRGVQLGLLPHLDYRGHELVQVVERVDHPALQMAFDTANPFPVCEEPATAARAVLPRSVAVALKDVQIFPHRSNDVTIWGTPLGQGSVDFDSILPLLGQLLPEPHQTTLSIKLRLPPDQSEHAAWMEASLDYVRQHPALAGQLTS